MARTAVSSAAAAPEWTCQKTPAEIRYVRPPTSACTAPGGRTTLPRTTRPVLPAPGGRGVPRPRGVMETKASPGLLPVTTSSSVACGHREARAPVAATAGPAMGQSSTSSSSCERCWRKPTAPFPSTATRTRLRQCSPPTSPSTGSTSTERSMPATRLELLGHPERLQPALRAELHVLEVAASAAPGAGVRARRRDPVGGRRQDLHGVGPQVPGGRGGDQGDDPLTREGVAHEDDPPVGGPAHAAAAGGDGADLQLEKPAVARGSHDRSVRWATGEDGRRGAWLPATAGAGAAHG